MRILSVGYDKNLLEPEREGNESQHRQKRYCEILDQEKVMIVLGSGDLVRERNLAGGRLRIIGVSSKSLTTRTWRAYRAGCRIGKQFKPDLVEYQDLLLSGWVAFLVAATLRIPLAGGVFSDYLDNPVWIRNSWRRRLLNMAGKIILSRSVGVRCDSKETAAALNRKEYAPFHYVPFYVPWLEKFATGEECSGARMNRWKRRPVVLCVARLSEEKNISLLLRAFRDLVAFRKNVLLRVVGTGPLQGSLKELSQSLGIDSQVEWVGWADYFDLPQYYENANIFVLPSDSETSARVLILAQAASLPTISTETSGARDIVSHGRTGFITPIGDEGVLAETLKRLLTEQRVYREMLFSKEYKKIGRYGDDVIDVSLRRFYEDCLAAAKNSREKAPRR